MSLEAMLQKGQDIPTKSVKLTMMFSDPDVDFGLAHPIETIPTGFGQEDLWGYFEAVAILSQEAIHQEGVHMSKWAVTYQGFTYHGDLNGSTDTPAGAFN